MADADNTHPDRADARGANESPRARRSPSPQDGRPAPAPSPAVSEPTTHQAAYAATPGRRQPEPEPFVRTRSPHLTQPPVDDLADDDLMADSAQHDSSYIKPSKNPLAGIGYRRSRSKMPQLQHELHYGQYLEMPKGRRSIFASQEQRRHQRGVIAGIIVVAVLAIVGFLIWRGTIGS